VPSFILSGAPVISLSSLVTLELMTGPQELGHASRSGGPGEKDPGY
jgi:hypothetical protein